MSYLETFVLSVPAGLEYVIAEGGDNLSIGQRQLVCLARSAALGHFSTFLMPNALSF